MGSVGGAMTEEEILEIGKRMNALKPFDLEEHKKKMRALDASHRGFPWGLALAAASTAR
jgi:hypothetical protein